MSGFFKTILTDYCTRLQAARMRSFSMHLVLMIILRLAQMSVIIGTTVCAKTSSDRCIVALRAPWTIAMALIRLMRSDYAPCSPMMLLRKLIII